MNDINFLLNILKRLKRNGIDVWLFGGWAEELLGMTQPREHRDIDLLYPYNDFDKLEKFMEENDDIQEIEAKRFVHKRAFLSANVMIEFFLLKKEFGKYTTDFFGKYKYQWPDNTIGTSIKHKSVQINITSQESLKTYRQTRGLIAQVCGFPLSQE